MSIGIGAIAKITLTLSAYTMLQHAVGFLFSAHHGYITTCKLGSGFWNKYAICRIL